MRYYEMEGDSPDIIIAQFLKENNIPNEYVEYEVLETGSKGIFGIGKKLTKIKIKYNDVEHIKRKSRMALTDMLEKAGFDDAHVSVTTKDKKIFLNVETQYSDILIGKHAQTLDAIQYLMDKMIRTDENMKTSVIVDVSSYRQRNVEKNIEKALALAEQVKRTGKSVKLQPMVTMIRKEIHIALKDVSGITTISSGEGQIKQICIICEKKGTPSGRKNFRNNRGPKRENN